MARTSFLWLTVVMMVSVAPMAWADSPPNYVDAFGGFGCCGLNAPNGLFDYPKALVMTPAGTLYVADSINDRVEYFTPSGVYLGKWGGLDNPGGIAVAPDGTIYVTDSDNDRIVQFSATGTVLNTWGVFGTGLSEFDFPTGIAVDAVSQVYVSDTGNDRIQQFRGDGTFVREFGGSGTAVGQLNCPTGLVIGPGGSLYVADACNSRIQRFSSSGQFPIAWGSFGSASSQFISPQGLGVDLNGAVYVADSGNDRVQKFNRDGLYMSEWTSTSPGNTFQRPVGVAVSPGMNFEIYVVDSETHLAYRFAYPATGVPGDGLVTPFPVRVFPNPASSRAQVSFRVESASEGMGGADVCAEVFDIAGRAIRTLHDGFLAEGEQTLTWNGRDRGGRKSGAGVYFVRVVTGGRPAGTARFVLTR